MDALQQRKQSYCCALALNIRLLSLPPDLECPSCRVEQLLTDNSLAVHSITHATLVWVQLWKVKVKKERSCFAPAHKARQLQVGRVLGKEASGRFRTQNFYLAVELNITTHHEDPEHCRYAVQTKQSAQARLQEKGCKNQCSPRKQPRCSETSKSRSKR